MNLKLNSFTKFQSFPRFLASRLIPRLAVPADSLFDCQFHEQANSTRRILAVVASNLAIRPKFKSLGSKQGDDQGVTEVAEHLEQRQIYEFEPRLQSEPGLPHSQMQRCVSRMGRDQDGTVTADRALLPRAGRSHSEY